MVPKQEIVEKEYDLLINKYKKVKYVPVEYPPTEEIMREIMELNMRITEEIEELREELKQ